MEEKDNVDVLPELAAKGSEDMSDEKVFIDELRSKQSNDHGRYLVGGPAVARQVAVQLAKELDSYVQDNASSGCPSLSRSSRNSSNSSNGVSWSDTLEQMHSITPLQEHSDEEGEEEDDLRIVLDDQAEMNEVDGGEEDDVVCLYKEQNDDDVLCVNDHEGDGDVEEDDVECLDNEPDDDVLCIDEEDDNDDEMCVEEQEEEEEEEEESEGELRIAEDGEEEGEGNEDGLVIDAPSDEEHDESASDRNLPNERSKKKKKKRSPRGVDAPARFQIPDQTDQFTNGIEQVGFDAQTAFLIGTTAKRQVSQARVEAEERQRRYDAVVRLEKGKKGGVMGTRRGRPKKGRAEEGRGDEREGSTPGRKKHKQIFVECDKEEEIDTDLTSDMKMHISREMAGIPVQEKLTREFFAQTMEELCDNMREQHNRMKALIASRPGKKRPEDLAFLNSEFDESLYVRPISEPAQKQILSSAMDPEFRQKLIKAIEDIKEEVSGGYADENMQGTGEEEGEQPTGFQIDEELLVAPMDPMDEERDVAAYDDWPEMNVVEQNYTQRRKQTRRWLREVEELEECSGRDAPSYRPIQVEDGRRRVSGRMLRKRHTPSRMCYSVFTQFPDYVNTNGKGVLSDKRGEMVSASAAWADGHTRKKRKAQPQMEEEECVDTGAEFGPAGDVGCGQVKPGELGPNNADPDAEMRAKLEKMCEGVSAMKWGVREMKAAKARRRGPHGMNLFFDISQHRLQQSRVDGVVRPGTCYSAASGASTLLQHTLAFTSGAWRKPYTGSVMIRNENLMYITQRIEELSRPYSTYKPTDKECENSVRRLVMSKLGLVTGPVRILGVDSCKKEEEKIKEEEQEQQSHILPPLPVYASMPNEMCDDYGAADSGLDEMALPWNEFGEYVGEGGGHAMEAEDALMGELETGTSSVHIGSALQFCNDFF